MSDDNYQLIKNNAKKHNADIYPSLHKLFEEKQKCYPSNLKFTEISAKCDLSDMIKHTISRIIELVKDDIEPNDKEAVFHFKAGFDGASSQSVYKQKFEDAENAENCTEESLFQTALVPLRLVIGERIVWQNVKPNSSLFCRPLNIQFRKETKELSLEEYEDLKAQIEVLTPYVHNGLSIKSQVDLTMFDNKVVNALTNTNFTQSCNICKAGPKILNNIELLKTLPVDKFACSLGLSTLHCHIRIFEYVLHLGYKMDIKKHQARLPEEKLSVAERKKAIQDRFKTELSLLVDQPKVGHGNTNDGNTARRAFENPELFSDITGVNLDVIKDLKTVLIAVCSGYHLHNENFQAFCDKTLELIVRHYDWYVIPPTVHKLLMHGNEIAANLELPIGQYSEEAQETQHKELRYARLFHTCKISRLNVMKNLYHFMLIRTDPAISNISFKKHKSSGGGKALPDCVQELLK